MIYRSRYCGSFSRKASLVQTLDFFKSLIPAPLYTPLKRLYHTALCQLERRSDHENAMIPPPHMNFVGDGEFVEVGKHLVDIMRRTVNLKPSYHVLDVGFGIGRVAIPLTRFLDKNGKYDGLEIVQSGISWCESRITPRYPNFKFKHADIFNSYYNPKGRFKAENYILPNADKHFDLVFLTSVFTHMMPKEVEHYLNEIHRVLKPNGRCFASFFILNQKSSEMIAAEKACLASNLAMIFAESMTRRTRRRQSHLTKITLGKYF